jgi:hypothetical protein
MIVVTLNIRGNPQKIAAGISGITDHPKLKEIASLAAVEAWQNHLDQHYVGKPNKLGGAATGYWSDVRNKIFGRPNATGAQVTARGPGLSMKYDGGTVRPGKGTSSFTGRPTQYLAIPVSPLSHGKRPGDFGKSLFLVQLHGPAAAAGLVRRQGRSNKRGQLLFILTKQAKIKADRNITPPASAVVQNMQLRVKQFLASGAANT